MPNAKMITYVKDNTIPHTKGRVIGHLRHIQSLIKIKPLTYSDLFAALDSDRSWMGGSKQTVKSLLSGTLSALRENGAIKDCAPPKEKLVGGVQAAAVETAAARAERLAARVAAKKAANKERYKKIQLQAYLKQVEDDKVLAELKEKLAISDANAQAAIERADKAEAQVAVLEKAVADGTAELQEAENEFQETVDAWRTHSEELEMTVEKVTKDANSISYLFLFNLICALFGAYYLGIAFPGAYTAAADGLAANYQLARDNAPILYQRALTTASFAVEPALNYVTASVRPVLDYASSSAQPAINYFLDI